MYKLILILIITLYCCCGYADPSINQTPNVDLSNIVVSDAVDKIKLLRSQNKLDEAGSFAIAFLQVQPNSYDVMTLLGLIYLQKKDYQNAALILNKVIAKYPDYADAKVGLIEANIQMGAAEADEVKKLSAEELSLFHQYYGHVEEKIKQTNHEKLKALASSQLNNKPIVQVAVPVNTKPTKIDLAKIQQLRKRGKLNEAKELSLTYLKSNPDDVDVMVILGLIFLQQKEYDQSISYLSQALQKVPTYMDARIGLIKAILSSKETINKKLMLLINTGLKQDKRNTDLLKLKNSVSQMNVKPKAWDFYTYSLDLAKRYTVEKKYGLAEQIYNWLLKNNPYDNDVRMLLTNLELELGKDRTAYIVIHNGVVLDPSNEDFLVKQGQVHFTLRQYALADQSYKDALRFNATDKRAKAGIAEVDDISPRYYYGMNEIGISTDNAWVQDLHETWDFSSLYYNRDTSAGRLSLKVNYASRLGFKAPQYEVDFSPRMNRNVYFDLMAAYANKPELFPKYAVGAEGYWNIPEFLELSGGTKYSDIGPTYFSTRTVSFTRYQGPYMITFRPYYYEPKAGEKSILYTATARRYSSTDDHYIGANIGTGHSPDLADLQTVNFIVITNNFINLTYEFPLFNHRLVGDIGVGYMRWGYPSGLVRNLYDGSIGIKCRF